MAASSTFQEHELLEAFRNGERRAFEEIYNRYYEQVFIYSYKLTRNEKEAEDISITTLSKLFFRHNREPFFQSTRHLTNWLYIAARNACFTYKKSFKVKLDMLSTPIQRLRDGDAPQIENLNTELDIAYILAIRAFIDGMPALEQKIIRMLFYEGYKFQEIADLLKINVSKVTRTRLKALNALRDILQTKEPADAICAVFVASLLHFL